MKKSMFAIACGVLGLVLGLPLQSCSVAETNGRPPGVSADHWVQLSPTAGIHKAEWPIFSRGGDAALVGNMWVFHEGKWFMLEQRGPGEPVKK